MIKFESIGVDLPSLDYDLLRIWIEAVAKDHHYSVGRLHYILCDDDYILDANRKYLQHDYYTDIITFDYTARNRISGDIILSLDTVKSNAEQIGEDYNIELLRVIIHGVLHLCGINDKGPGEREIMEENENRALELLKNITKNEI